MPERNFFLCHKQMLYFIFTTCLIIRSFYLSKRVFNHFSLPISEFIFIFLNSLHYTITLSVPIQIISCLLITQLLKQLVILNFYNAKAFFYCSGFVCEQNSFIRPRIYAFERSCIEIWMEIELWRNCLDVERWMHH